MSQNKTRALSEYRVSNSIGTQQTYALRHDRIDSNVALLRPDDQRLGPVWPSVFSNPISRVFFRTHATRWIVTDSKIARRAHEPQHRQFLRRNQCYGFSTENRTRTTPCRAAVKRSGWTLENSTVRSARMRTSVFSALCFSTRNRNIDSNSA